MGFSHDLLQASAAYFPAVGWVIGIASASVFWVISHLLPAASAAPWVAAVMSTIFSVLMTGGFHEDGLADVADGLGGVGSTGGEDVRHALEIMKDSRIGAFGAMALVLALMAKVSVLGLIGQIDIWTASFALFSGHVVSRFWPLLLIRTLPYVAELAGSKSKPLAERISGASLLIAGLWLFAALGLVIGLQYSFCWLSGFALSAVGCFWMYRLFKRRLGGFTGDCLGATQQVCEITFLLGIAFAL